MKRLVPLLCVGLLGACSGTEPSISSRYASELGDGHSVQLDGEVPESLSFSPDGRILAYLGSVSPSARHFRVAVVRDGRPQSVTPDTVDASAYAWMPDSRSVLVAARGPDSGELIVFSLVGDELRRIPLERQLRIEAGMTVRRDGTVAVVTAFRGTGSGASDLVEVDLGSGGTRDLTSTASEAERDPIFFDDGRIAYVLDRKVQPGQPRSASAAVLEPSSGRVDVISPTDLIVLGIGIASVGTLVLDAVHDQADDRGLWAMRMATGEVGRLTDHGGPFAVDVVNDRLVVASRSLPSELLLVDVDLGP